MSERKFFIIKADMSDEMQEFAVDFAILAFIKHRDKTVCQYTEVTCLVIYELPNVQTLPLSGYGKVYMRGI